ncbi:MAG: type I glyceraldehyde-3-phosphate dehydrogenase [Firmicutes bacterium]|nr:type I glyceraldehyde-3-phosphate dehydrogenase [Bacillota bacterium]
MIGINGLGRIGRLAARQLARRGPGHLAAINDPAGLEILVHLLRYDSVHRMEPLRVEGERRGDQDFLVIEQEGQVQRVPLFHHRDPAEIPWDRTSAQVVIESSGRFTRRADAARHLRGAVGHVVISAPSPDPDFTVIAPVNGRQFDFESHRVVSNASCTAHATAPMLAVLEDAFGLESSTMSTVHVATNDQRLVDAPHGDLRRARAAMIGIHPTTSSAFGALKQALPWLKKDFDGWALRVPTLSVNLVDLTALVKRDVTVEAVNAAFREASEGAMKGMVGLAEAPLVSCDFTGRRESVVMDLELTQVLGGRLLKVFGWHDNETAYATRLVELVEGWVGRAGR